MKIVFPDRIDFDAATRARVKDLGIVTYNDTPNDITTIIERIRDAEIITVNFIDLPKEAIDAAPKLKFIISSAAGYNNIDYKYAASKDIKVLNCPTYNSEAVVEHAIALMLAVSRRVVEASEDLRAGAWHGQDIVGSEISHKKLGLVGYGRVGKLIEQRVKSFDMKVRHCSSSSSAEELDNLLQTSDIVCLCLALNDSTQGIIDKRRLDLLQSHAILINVARGGLVDQKLCYHC